MRKDLTYISTVGMSATDWLAYRNTGIGASEIGTILGLNPYKASVTMFYEKIGMLESNIIESIAMFMGKHTEAMIADFWQYWDGDEESLMRNFNAKTIVRRCSKVNAYVRNPKYTWLFVSLDRRINKVGGREGALECKNMSYHAARVWETGIPPMYVTQIQQQIGVCGLDFGDLAVWQDGRNFMVYPFEPSKEIFKTIVDRSKVFWDKIVAGRKLYAQIIHHRATMNMRGLLEIQAELDTLEPPPDGSDAYREYQNKKYEKSTAGEVPGTAEYLAKALEHLKLRDKIKKLSSSSKLLEQQLIAGIGSMQKMTFGQNGYVSFKTDSNGHNRFNNAVKLIKP